MRDSRLLPLTPKNSNDNDGKGAMVSRTMRPYFLLYFCMQSCMQQAERQNLEGIAEEKDKTKTTRQNQRAKAKRGFWGVGARLAYPHSTPIAFGCGVGKISTRIARFARIAWIVNYCNNWVSESQFLGSEQSESIRAIRVDPNFEPVSKNQPNEEVLGRISLWTSPQKLRSGPPNPGKTSILAWTSRAGVHEKTSVCKTLG